MVKVAAGILISQLTLHTLLQSKLFRGMKKIEAHKGLDGNHLSNSTSSARVLES